MTKYLIYYKIPGKEETLCAGPYYSFLEAEYQKKDIETYQGIYNVWIEPIGEPNEKEAN